MKKLIVILLLFFTCSAIAADFTTVRKRNLPQGTFKKKRNGVIVQYDSRGKKIGEYKLGPGTYTKIK